MGEKSLCGALTTAQGTPPEHLTLVMFRLRLVVSQDSI